MSSFDRLKHFTVATCITVRSPLYPLSSALGRRVTDILSLISYRFSYDLPLLVCVILISFHPLGCFNPIFSASFSFRVSECSTVPIPPPRTPPSHHPPVGRLEVPYRTKAQTRQRPNLVSRRRLRYRNNNVRYHKAKTCACLRRDELDRPSHRDRGLS